MRAKAVSERKCKKSKQPQTKIKKNIFHTKKSYIPSMYHISAKIQQQQQQYRMKKKTKKKKIEEKRRNKHSCAIINKPPCVPFSPVCYRLANRPSNWKYCCC